MLENPLSRRDLLSLAAALLLAPVGRLAAAESTARRGKFTADIGVLYRVMSFHMEGEVEENIDREAGRYEVRLTGQGSGISNRIESSGELREGRWAPVRSASWFEIQGRESRTRIAYDYQRRSVEYHAYGETFFMRRMSAGDDVVTLHEGEIAYDAYWAAPCSRDW
jgi:hypothetical protein